MNIKSPLRVVDKWGGDNLTQRPQGPFAVVRLRQLRK